MSLFPTKENYTEPPMYNLFVPPKKYPILKKFYIEICSKALQLKLFGSTSRYNLFGILHWITATIYLRPICETSYIEGWVYYV